MSVPQTKIPESKSKSKFQSLNINNLYQGAASKPQSKNLPPKHGLQSLGKVPTARRAPANLPSVKSEKGGNDPSVVLVPTGGGWANKEGDKEVSGGVERSGGGQQPLVEQGQVVKERQGVVDIAGTAPAKQQSPPSKPSGVKSWSSVTGAGQGGPHGGRQQSFLHQKSPLFGQEFPSLKPGEVAPAVSQTVKGSTPEQVEPVHPTHHPVVEPPPQADPAYGPGPNLRPQTFGNWTQGGAAAKVGGSGGPQTDGAELLPLVPPQPHKPVPPQAPPANRSPPTNQYKSIMPPFMDAMELPTGPPPNFSHRRSAPRQGGGQAPRHRESRPRPPPTEGPGFIPPSIIDKEKLKRMDDIDNGDDWTYEDDDFDYNKKLESEDEDTVEVAAPIPPSDPNWADQVPSGPMRSPHQPPQQQNFNFYEEFKQKGGVGFGVDEEEKRRNKKSEEVMKNIERARQRREEEENRYRRQPGQEQEREGGNHYRDNYRQRQEGGGKYEERGQPRRGGGGGGEGRQRNYDERERYERERHYEGGYREEGPPPPHYKRKDDYRGERRYEREEELHPRERQEYGRHREGWERENQGQQPFDMEGEDRRRTDRPRYPDRERSPGQARSPGHPRSPAGHPRSPGLTPQYQRHDSEVSATESSEADRDRRQQVPLGSTSPDWVDKNSHTIQDWVEDVEEGDSRDVPQQYPREKEYDREFRDSEGREYDRPSRPNSRDSRVSKESRGSKESKGSRTSRDREMGLGIKKEEKSAGKYEKDVIQQSKPQNDFEHEKKGRQPKQAPVQDLRGYFRDGLGGGLEQEKKTYRHAPGPITREKLESVEVRESMTQLKKRETTKNEEKLDVKEEPEKVEPPVTLSGLVDADMLENISEDEDNLLDEGEKEVNTAGNRGRGTGRGWGQKDRQFVSYPRGKGERGGDRGDRGDRGGRGGRGGRMDNKRGGGMQNRWNDNNEEMEENEEDRRMKKQFGQNQNQNNSWGFMPRGQPSRRGRGEGRVRQGGGGGVGRQRGFDDFGNEEIGEWGDDEMERKGGGRGKIPPRMQRGRRDGARPGSGGGEEGEEWETASETSLEEREKRNKARGESQSVRARGGGRGGRGGQQQGGHWDKPRRGAGNAGGGSQTGAGGPAEGHREGTPEAPAKRGPGIENFDLNDYAGVVIVDDPQWAEAREGEVQGEYNNMDNAEGFMQVVSKKTRGGMGPQGKDRDRRMMDNRMNDRNNDRNDYRRPGGPDMFDKKMSKTAYDRRQSKLPPRLAKQREVVRAQARSGPGQLSPSPGNENGWPEGDKMGVFTVEPDIGTGAWEKPMEGGGMNQAGGNNENGSIQQTIIFENTAFKGGKSEKMDKTGPGGPIQLPLSFGKQEADNADLKLDFTFGGDDIKPGSGPAPPLSIPRSLTAGGLPASPSTDDLQTKLANTKKLWDAPGMPVVPENSTAGGSWNESDLYGENGAENAAEKNGEREAGPVNSPHSVVSNVAKVKPQQQQLNLDSDNRANNAALQYNRMAVPSPSGNHSLPPSQLTPVQPWAFLPDASRTSPMYNPYSQLNQSILMPGVTGHNINTDLFNSNNGGYRGVPNFPGSGGHTTTNNVLISQASLINSQVKLGSGIGPIGTKAGAGGPGPSSPYLTNLPNTNSNIFIQYDNSGNPLNLPNYLPGSAPHPGPGRGSTPSQTAFYQSLAAANRQQQAFNALQGFNSAQHALSQQQLRASAVAGMPFLKSDQAKSPVSISDSGFTATACPYNGRATNPGGPPSPKTKLKMAQQQEQAKITANMNNLQNLNNLNALAQMQRSMGLGQYNPLGGLVQPTVPGQYNPSPIARPQVSLSQGGALMTGAGVQGQINKQMNQYFNQEGVDGDKYEGGEEVVAADKGDAEEATEELCEAGQETAQQPPEQEAGAAN